MNNLTSFIKKIYRSRYFYIYLILIVHLFVAAFYITPNFKIAEDAVTYNEAVQFLEGQNLEVVPYNRLLTTPLFLISATVLDNFVNNINISIFIINLILFFLIPLVFYNLAFLIFKEGKTAFLSTMLLVSNYYLINIDNFFIADMGGRFFLILTNLLALKYYLSGEITNKKKYYYFAILSASIGVLFKEFGALGIISLGSFILISNFSLKEKIKSIFKAGILFSIIPIIFHYIFYLKFNYSYFDWYSTNITFYPEEANQYGFGLFIKVLGWLFLAGWPIFVYGSYKLWKEKNSFDRSKLLILGTLLPASLSFFIWPMFMQRTMFVLVPWLCLIAGFGLSRISNKYIIGLILCIYIAVSYNMERLLLFINLPF